MNRMWSIPFAVGTQPDQFAGCPLSLSALALPAEPTSDGSQTSVFDSRRPNPNFPLTFACYMLAQKTKGKGRKRVEYSNIRYATHLRTVAPDDAARAAWLQTVFQIELIRIAGFLAFHVELQAEQRKPLPGVLNDNRDFPNLSNPERRTRLQSPTSAQQIRPAKKTTHDN